MTRAYIALTLIFPLFACQGEKGGTETESGTGSSSTGAPTTTAGATSGPGETTESEPTTAATGATSATTGSPAATCGDLPSQAQCEAAESSNGIFRCFWIEVKQVEEASCSFGASEASCVAIEVNDGGCSTCLFKDLGGGQFAVIDGGESIGCNNVPEFSSCLYEDGEGSDPPVCACICQ